MKARHRTCEGCGKTETTASSARLCLTCFVAGKVEENKQRDHALLSAIYDDIVFGGKDNHGKCTWTFTHAACGTRQTWMIGNVKKQMKARPDSVPCSKCGGKARQQKAMAGYIEKYGLDEKARTDLRAYTRKVRGISEKTYRDNIDAINPERHPRLLGNQGWHLDHRVAIVECFRQGWPPEKAGSLDNLQMLPAGENMSKGRRHN